MDLSILITTVGRESLVDMLDSIGKQLSEGDRIYVVVDGEEYHEAVAGMVMPLSYDCKLEVFYERENLGWWGHGIRNKYQTQLAGDYIIHADDDDVFMDGAVDKIRRHLSGSGEMLLFRFIQQHGAVVWKFPTLFETNIGTPCGVIPNIPSKMGTWGYRYGGDFDFYNSCEFEHRFICQHTYFTSPHKAAPVKREFAIAYANLIDTPC